MKEIATCYKKYFDFTGKASRKEFCYFFNYWFVSMCLLGGANSVIEHEPEPELWLLLIGVLFWLLYLSTIIPLLAVTSRRWHDLGRSGWWTLLWLFPCIGIIVGIYLAYAESSSKSEEGNTETTQG